MKPSTTRHNFRVFAHAPGSNGEPGALLGELLPHEFYAEAGRAVRIDHLDPVRKRLGHDGHLTVDWLAHMHPKQWMNWSDFMDMVKRFRVATDSFNSLHGKPSTA